MDQLFEYISDAIHGFLVDLVGGVFIQIFDEANAVTGSVASEVAKSPSEWNSGVFGMIQNLSNNVMLPIAGMIITFVLCYELITAITERNNMRDVDVDTFIKYIFKACVGVFLLSHTFEIVLGIFDVTHWIVNTASASITNDTYVDVTKVKTKVAFNLTKRQLICFGIAGVLARRNSDMANIRKRGNSYQIRVSCGYDKDGNQVSKTMTWKPAPSMTPKQAEKEVQKQAALFEEKCLKGCVTTSVKFEELAEQWFIDYAKPNLRNYTYDGMKRVTRRVYPAIGHLKVDKITSRHIQQFITDLAVNGKSLRDGNTLARKTVIHHLSFISDVMTYAVKLGMISDNPCSSVTVPKGSKKEKEIYTIDEIKRLFELSETAPLKYRTFFVLSVYSGFRRAEMLGLEWKDIDFDSNIISVRRTSNYTKADGYYTDTTKTKTSQRSMKFPDHVMALLKEWKAEQEDHAKLMGTKWVANDRLFTKDNGEPMFTGMPYKWLERVCTANNLPFYGIHSLRHINNMKTFLLKNPLKITYLPTRKPLYQSKYSGFAMRHICDVLKPT